ncbi:hypothetical protein [Streptomyces sp. NRRL B-1347]|uniref:hypothetical protein n=1 Tax=Streptomyces sp. NRRL B-1347 TaxID=1476877 RepID=UPI0004C5DD8F|nr:hypothetical protein [Streptomyces sp. NRRL B-1347]
MTLFLYLGIAGVSVLAVSLALGQVFEGLFGAVLEGLFGGLFSLPVLAGFVAMFGFSGALTLGLTDLGAWAGAAVGVGAGAVTGWLAWQGSRVLMRDESPPPPRGSDLVGSAGSVVTAIPADGYGEVLLQLAGQRVKLSARSVLPVPRGTEVWVEASLSETAVAVRPVER